MENVSVKELPMQSEECNREECSKYENMGYERLERAVNMVGGKWKLRILYFVAWHEVIRYNELWRALGSVTHNMLSRQLKEMEKDGLLVRKEYPQVPPKVEYSLSEKGWDLLPVVEVLCGWIEKYID